MSFEVDENGTCWIEGISYPAIGFGTYPLKDEICFKAVTQAGQTGYRIIDTATAYANFMPIGQALKTLGRDKFYLVSKVWPHAQAPDKLQKDAKSALTQLQTDYLDAYLLHWPNSKIPIEDTLQAMKELQLAGLVRHIGLSNVTVNHLKRVLELKIPISWVQIEMHPLFYDADLFEFCQKHLLTIQAWAPLARGRIREDLMLNQLSEKYGKTATQIALKWIVQHQCVALPCSKNEQHIHQNINIEDFKVSLEDMQRIDHRASQGQRERITESHNLGFSDEFDFSYDSCWPKGIA